MQEFLLSCWIASVIATFILTHKITTRASEREIADQRALIDKLHAALVLRPSGNSK
jgi:hypothetical protein